MAKLFIQANSTSHSEYVFIQNSTSTTGAGLTGLVFNSAGLTAYYAVERGAATAITLVTLASATAAYSSGGFVAVDGTNMPGLYRFDVPNALFSVAGTKNVVVMLKGATNMAPVLLEYQIVAFDPNDAVRLGITALPNANAGASGGLPTGNASGQVTVATNNDKTAYSLSGTQTFNVTGNITGNVTGSVGSIASGGITSGSFAAGAINAAAIATDAIGSDELAASATAEIADAILARKLDSTGNETTSSTANERTVRSALRYLRNKVGISGSTMTVSLEDDTTSAWTATLTTSPGVDPVTTIDPA